MIKSLLTKIIMEDMMFIIDKYGIAGEILDV